MKSQYIIHAERRAINFDKPDFIAGLKALIVCCDHGAYACLNVAVMVITLLDKGCDLIDSASIR